MLGETGDVGEIEVALRGLGKKSVNILIFHHIPFNKILNYRCTNPSTVTPNKQGRIGIVKPEIPSNR